MGEISEEQRQICLKSDRVTFLGLVLVADSLIFFFFNGNDKYAKDSLKLNQR